MTFPELVEKYHKQYAVHNYTDAAYAINSALLQRLGLPAEGVTFGAIEEAIASLERAAADGAKARLRAFDNTEKLQKQINEREAAIERLEAELDATDRRLRAARRDLANWERKYERVRRALDPDGVIPESQYSLVALAAGCRAAYLEVARRCFMGSVKATCDAFTAAAEKVKGGEG